VKSKPGGGALARSALAIWRKELRPGLIGRLALCLAIVVSLVLLRRWGTGFVFGTRTALLIQAFVAGALPVVVYSSRALTTEHGAEWIVLTLPVSARRYFGVKIALAATVALACSCAFLLGVAERDASTTSLDRFAVLVALVLFAVNSVGFSVGIWPRLGQLAPNPVPSAISIAVMLAAIHLLPAVVADVRVPGLILLALAALVSVDEIRTNTRWLLDPEAKTLSPLLSATLLLGTFLMAKGIVLMGVSIVVPAELARTFGRAGADLAGTLATVALARHLVPISFWSRSRARNAGLSAATRLIAAGAGVLLAVMTTALLKELRGAVPAAAVSSPPWDFLLMVVLSSACEEVVLRRYVQPHVRAAVGPWWAVSTVAIAFASLHPAAPFGPLALGLASGIVFQKTADVVSCALLHVGFNLAVLMFK
jgi:membrane protease YdiL (CAAX protease family)